MLSTFHSITVSNLLEVYPQLCNIHLAKYHFLTNRVKRMIYFCDLCCTKIPLSSQNLFQKINFRPLVAITKLTCTRKKSAATKDPFNLKSKWTLSSKGRKSVDSAQSHIPHWDDEEELNNQKYQIRTASSIFLASCRHKLIKGSNIFSWMSTEAARRLPNWTTKNPRLSLNNYQNKVSTRTAG